MDWIKKDELRFLSKSARKRIKFSRKFLSDKLESNKDLVCHYCAKNNLIIELNIHERIENSVKATIDHIIPISKGGEILSESNVVVCCAICNGKRGNKDYNEYIEELGWIGKNYLLIN